ncbi:UNVERIFIED_CONTAM: hypothetical protein Sangu_1998500 [Sesamum angustifolium]|uniref:Exosome complex exonuclease Rrp40 N-terminal domain-containing protein n=1 Tax=Sesamum angustifolium TaxID=2727405 RepID=A0AAW2LHL2_9LAMI
MESKPSVSPSSFVDQQVFPGDVVLDLSKMTNQTIKLGGGLRQDGDVISVMKAGKLRFSKPNKYWVESSHKRRWDNVLGIVVDAKADVNATSPSIIVLVANTIMQTESLSPAQQKIKDQHSRDASCITDMYEREDDRNTYRHRVMKSDFNYKLSPILVPVRILIQIKNCKLQIILCL